MSEGRQDALRERPPRINSADHKNVNDLEVWLDQLRGDDIVISTPLCVAMMIAAATRDIVDALHGVAGGVMDEMARLAR